MSDWTLSQITGLNLWTKYNKDKYYLKVLESKNENSRF